MNAALMILNAQIFLLIFARIFALLQTAPLLSSQAIPGIARVGLGLLTSVTVLPWMLETGYTVPDSGLLYAGLMVGEIMIGIILGFMLTIIFSAFQVAGQFFSMQMGLGASMVFDPMAQIELPLMGQFLNLMAMFVFISVGGMRNVFLAGVLRSFQTVGVAHIVMQRESVAMLMVTQLVNLFEQALILSFPILGTLLLVSVALGLLAKAAPQMNLLMLGFPVKIGIAFMMLFICLPFLLEVFGRLVDRSFLEMVTFLTRTGESS